MPETTPDEIKTTVTFPLGDGPYQHSYLHSTPVRTVLNDALTHFKVTTDGTTRYYLLHDGLEIDVTTTVGAVAAHAHAVHFTLRTETIQG